MTEQFIFLNGKGYDTPPEVVMMTPEKITIGGYPVEKLEGASLETLLGLLAIYSTGFASERLDYVKRDLPTPFPASYQNEIRALRGMIQRAESRATVFWKVDLQAELAERAAMWGMDA